MITKILKTLLCFIFGFAFVIMPVGNIMANEVYVCKSQICPALYSSGKKVVLRGFPISHTNIKEGQGYYKDRIIENTKTIPLIIDFSLGVLAGWILIITISKAKSKIKSS